MTDLSRWLDEAGLAKHASVFEDHEITWEVLPHLTESDVDRLGLPIGARRKLLVALKTVAPPATPLVTGEHGVNSPPAIPAADRRQLTVVFCDLVGSTALSERLDPEELREHMQGYRRAVTEVVARYEGHVAQYLGDGLMVYFGWPHAHEDDAERGVRASLEVVRAVEAVGGAHPLVVRLGVATGTVVVGEAQGAVNAEARLAVGETPNLAARLQGIAGPGEVVIAAATRRLLGDAFELTDLGASSIKGISGPVQVWRVDDVRRTGGRFEAAHGGSELSPLVGREAEVSLLEQRWQQAREGAGQVVLLGGEPGIGKSRLTQALFELAARDGCAVLRYQCSPYHLNSALYPFTIALEMAAGFLRTDTVEEKLDKMEAALAGSRELKEESAPLVAALLSLPLERYGQPSMSPQKRKDKTLDALARQVEALSRDQPVLMVFEDAHWVDPTSQELLDVLVPTLRHLPVLLVVTHRPEYTKPWDDTHVSVLGLGRLGRHHGAELVARVTGGRGLPTEVLERIVAQTDGVPLFVEELTKSVLESGLLRESGDSYTLEHPLPALAIPTSLRDSLLARLDRLAAVKDVIQIGACIGREFSHDLLSRVAGLREDQLERRLARITDAGLVYRTGSPPHATYTFKHALVQDAAYDTLLKSRRTQLHAQIADVLARDFAPQVASEPELLAHHYTQSGNLTAAIPRWREAGQVASQRLGVREAVVHFQKGLSLVEQLSTAPERDELELSIREPLNASWTGLLGWAAAEVRGNASAILALTQRLGKSQSAGTGLWATWVNTTTQGRIADSLEFAQRLLTEGEQARDVDLRIFGHGASMITYFYLGELTKAREQGQQVLDLYDASQAARWMQVTAHDLRTLVGVWACQWTWMLGYPDQAVQVSDEKDVHARSLGDAFNTGFALTLGGYAFAYRGEAERLMQRVAEWRVVEQEHSVPFMNQVMVPQVEGLAQVVSGHVAEAVVSLRRGLENWHARGGHSRVPFLKSALAEALARDGQLDVALRTIDECLEQIERPGWQERSHLAEVLRLKAWILMQCNRAAEAEPLLRAAIDWARQQQAKSWELRAATTLAELLAARGEREGARGVLAPVYAWFTEGFETRDLRLARALLSSLDSVSA